MGQVMNVEGCTALITGANRGLGHALAGMLVQRGARKVYVAARDPTAIADSVTTAFVLILQSNGGGGIANVQSVVSWYSFPFNTTCCASKHAALALTDGLKTQLHSAGSNDGVIGNLAEMSQTSLRVVFRPHPDKCSSRTPDLRQLRICGRSRRLRNRRRRTGIVRSASFLESAAREDIGRRRVSIRHGQQRLAQQDCRVGRAPIGRRIAGRELDQPHSLTDTDAPSPLKPGDSSAAGPRFTCNPFPSSTLLLFN